MTLTDSLHLSHSQVFRICQNSWRKLRADFKVRRDHIRNFLYFSLQTLLWICTFPKLFFFNDYHFNMFWAHFIVWSLVNLQFLRPLCCQMFANGELCTWSLEKQDYKLSSTDWSICTTTVMDTDSTLTYVTYVTTVLWVNTLPLHPTYAICVLNLL